MRALDLRATFITVSLASNRTWEWCQQRTGHGDSMKEKYRRTAATWTAQQQGDLAPMHLTIPELAKLIVPRLPHGGGSGSARPLPKSSKVHGRGVEPLRLAAAEPKSAASASFATRAVKGQSRPNPSRGFSGRKLGMSSCRGPSSQVPGPRFAPAVEPPLRRRRANGASPAPGSSGSRPWRSRGRVRRRSICWSDPLRRTRGPGARVGWGRARRGSRRHAMRNDVAATVGIESVEERPTTRDERLPERDGLVRIATAQRSLRAVQRADGDRRG